MSGGTLKDLVVEAYFDAHPHRLYMRQACHSTKPRSCVILPQEALLFGFKKGPSTSRSQCIVAGTAGPSQTG